MRKALLITAIAALCVSAVSQESATIAWKPKEGHKTALRIIVNAEVQGAAVEVKIRTESTVLKVGEDGKVTIKGTEQMESLSFNGQVMEGAVLGPPTQSTYVMQKNGELISIETDNPNPNPRMEEANVFLFPDREVKKGESWTRTRAADPAKGIRASKTTYTYLGSETVDGELSHKVKIEFTETEGSAPMIFNATAWVSAANGDLIRLEGRMDNVEFDPSVPPGSATVRIERIKV